MESDDFETPENDDEPGPDNSLATSSTTSDRARRMRRLAVQG